MKTIFIMGLTILTGLVLLGFQYTKIQAQTGNVAKDKIYEETKLNKATFAGGCFWCTESDFEKIDGVVEAISGYTGGEEKNPTYAQVSSGMTGHTEAVQVLYDPEKVTYADLLEVFWRIMDPTDAGGQFVDRGPQYRSAIFYHNEDQRKLAEKSRQELEQSGRFDKPIVTEIVAMGQFYPAEEYHQDYYKKNALRYKFYRFGSGRDQFLRRVWGDETTYEKKDEQKPSGDSKYSKPSNELLKQKLTPLQYSVTRQDGTEPAFRNEYWNNKREGIYVNIVSGEPLFSSSDKYDSKTGWPSFTKPLVPGNIVKREDRSLFMVRTEVRSKLGNSHLGHVFPDGPPPTGLRYCINSAALRFIPYEDLEKEGYGEYQNLFSKIRIKIEEENATILTKDERILTYKNVRSLW